MTLRAKRPHGRPPALDKVRVVLKLRRDGGWLEAEMMAKAGATHVVVMKRAHPETIKAVVKAGLDFGVKVMGDNECLPEDSTLIGDNCQGR